MCTASAGATPARSRVRRKISAAGLRMPTSSEYVMGPKYSSRPYRSSTRRRTTPGVRPVLETMPTVTPRAASSRTARAAFGLSSGGWVSTGRV